MITLLEVLMNAEHNLKSDIKEQRECGMRQLSNVIYLFGEKDKGLHDVFKEEDLK